MTKRYETILFDLDGTLVHTMPEGVYEIVGNTLKEFNKKVSNQNMMRFYFEKNRENIIKTCFGLEPKSFWESYIEHDTPETRKKFSKAYDDVKFISELKKNSYKIGIVTGCINDVALMEVEMVEQKMQGAKFDCVICANFLNGLKPKPHPEGLEKCLNVLGSESSKAIYVGNSDEDVIAAKKIGVFDILIERNEHCFPETNPSLKIYSLYNLGRFLESS